MIFICLHTFSKVILKYTTIPVSRAMGGDFTLEFISVLMPEVMHSKEQITLCSRSCVRSILTCAAVQEEMQFLCL